MEKEEETSIQRCPHDKENPYAMLARDLLRDETISFACRGFLAYLLSMKDGWRINFKQLVTHAKATCGRDKVRSILDEALEAGYMMREEFLAPSGLQRCRYFISEKPKFKKCLPRTENPYAGNQEAENTYAKEEPSNLQEELKQVVCTPAPVAPQSDTFSVVKKKDFGGLEFEVSLQDVFKQCVLQRKSWTSQEIEDAFIILRDYDAPIRDWFHFVEGTIKNRRNVRKGVESSKIENKGKKPCQNQKSTTSTECNETSSAKDIRGLPSVASVWKQMQAEGFSPG